MNAPNEFPLDNQVRQVPDNDEPRHVEDRIADLDPGKASRILFWGITIFFVVIFIWAAFAEIDRTVRGQGRVISSSQLQVVTSLEGGVLEDILVQPGKRVQEGEALVRLDPTQSGAELGSSSATAAALDMKIARLRAEIAGRAPAYPQPANMEAAQQLQVERSLYSSRQAALRSALSAGQAQIENARQGVEQARASVQARQSALSQAQNEVNAVRPLVENGIEPRMTLTRAESQQATAQSDLAAARATLSQASSQVAEASANLARIRQDWREQAAGELAVAQADYEARASTLPALQERVARTTLRAPTTGQVSRVLVTTKGSAVSPGEPVVELVSDDDTLLIEARISPQDIGSVRLGQRAKVGISAYDQAVYGTLEGEVQTISPDSIVDPNSGEIYYLVRVATNDSALTGPSGRELEIGTGMVADVSLLGDKRTVLQYILTPITRLSETAFRE
ncbi:HlyD family type I secretion periplasmic adaptor subunit [Erythrobacter litoralis]|uniref:HlyD family type I secretion periplasmic adaptor subunit n=1 Tax=Erythrobacter litoralis TaxID=39960 RepID=UPI002434F1F9|nr:HlyD family type I secretion periplasmic adaptor subunit [Erythrobacter litoralis]MDG6080237.1 HlyD family type I secretion periplasmic adaptor subunit [Erythrobacter litoralis]